MLRRCLGRTAAVTLSGAGATRLRALRGRLARRPGTRARLRLRSARLLLTLLHCAAPLRLRLGSRTALLLTLLRRWLRLLYLLPWLPRRLPLLALLCCAAPLRLRLWSRAALLLMLLCRWLRLLRLLRRVRPRPP